jgi:ParB family chromosome partitioning protein
MVEVPRVDAPGAADNSNGSSETGGGPRRVPLGSLIANRANPRRDFDTDALDELTASIKEKGVMQPLLVRPVTGETDRFEIIAGERRWRAAQRAGLHDVPVIVREVDDKEALELAIIENVQRVDLNALEEALGYEQLIEQFDYTQQDLAQVIGKSRSHVANTLRLLKLPREVREMVSSGALTAGHARTLITSDDPATVAKLIVEQGLSVRQAESLAQKGATPKRAPETKSAVAPRDADTIALEKRLTDALGMTVAIDHRDKGGRVEIRYRTLEQLDAVIEKLSS